MSTDLHLILTAKPSGPGCPEQRAVPMGTPFPSEALLLPASAGTSSGSPLLLSKSPHFTVSSLCVGRNLEEKLLNYFTDIFNCSRSSCVRSGQHRLFRAMELHVW